MGIQIRDEGRVGEFARNVRSGLGAVSKNIEDLAAIRQADTGDQSIVRITLVTRQPSAPTGDSALYLAVAQVTQGANLSRGIEQLTVQIDRQKPRNAGFYLVLGEAWRNKGDARKALAAYQQAAARDPQSGWTLRRLADALQALGQAPQAAETLSRAIQV